MVLGVGCVHPKGEASDYEGLFYKQNEMQALASELKGKPLYIEHLDQKGQSGEICHAWVGKGKECFAMFETDDDTYHGMLAKNLIKNRIYTDLSLAHDCSVDKDLKIIQKKPVEVSIVEKGARPHTHIYSIGSKSFEPSTIKTKKSNYIIQIKSSYNKEMAEQQSSPVEPIAPVDTLVQDAIADVPDTVPSEINEVTDANAMFSELLSQMKEQQNALTAMKKKLGMAEEAKDVAEKKVEASNKRKRDERVKVVDGTLKEYISQMMSKFNDELAPYKDDLAKIVNGMKDHEESEPMIKLLSCAASAYGKNTHALETQFQKAKKLKTMLEKTRGELQEKTKPAFTNKQDRFKEIPKPSPPKQQIRLPPGISLVPRGEAGMQALNPTLWQSLAATASPGMGWFDEKRLVGKRYEEGRRPKPIV